MQIKVREPRFYGQTGSARERLARRLSTFGEQCFRQIRHLSYLPYVVVVGIHRNARVYVFHSERSREAVLREAAQDSGEIDAPLTGRHLDLFR